MLGELRSKDTNGWNPEFLTRRVQLIDTLSTYADRGVFPKNRHFPGRQVPIFIDDDGTRCAVAHLMESTGEYELVKVLAQHQNNALVEDIGDDPRLQAWLEHVGIDADEAARIQPSYCFMTVVACVCNLKAAEVVRATFQGWDSNHWDARVSEVFGDASLVAPGDVLHMTSRLASQGEMLIPILEGGAPGEASAIVGDRIQLECSTELPEPLIADVTAAWLANDCKSTMLSRDPQSAAQSCAYAPAATQVWELVEPGPEAVDEVEPTAAEPMEPRPEPVDEVEPSAAERETRRGGCGGSQIGFLAGIVGFGVLTVRSARQLANGPQLIE